MFQVITNFLIELGSYLFVSKSSVAHFVLLPDDLCQEIVFKFLPLLEIVRVDTAFCNSKQRKWFLRILQCYFINTHYMTRVREWQWISLRSVRVNRLCLSPRRFDAHEKLLFTVNCSDICELQLIDLTVNESILESFINQCPKLTWLWVENADSFTDNVALKITGSILKQLEMFKVDHEKASLELICTFVSHFAKYCTNLTELDVHLTSENDYTNTDDALTELITKNTGLKFIRLQSEKVCISDSLLDVIDTHCQQIQRISSENCDDISFSRVSEFVVKRQEQLIWISLIDEKVNDRRFTFSRNSTDNNEKRNKFLEVRGLNVDKSQELIEVFTKVAGFEIVLFTFLTWFVNSEVIAAMAKFSPNLNFLLLCQSGGYDLSMFKELFQNCRNLNRLILTRYDHVNNLQMEAIFSVPNTVTSLEFSSHASLSIDTILTILRANPQTRTLRCLKSLTNVDLTVLQSAIESQSCFEHVTLYTEPVVVNIGIE